MFAMSCSQPTTQMIVLDLSLKVLPVVNAVQGLCSNGSKPEFTRQAFPVWMLFDNSQKKKYTSKG